jgi:hypothetical protein
MAAELSAGTVRRIEILFPEAERAEAAAMLVSECGDNLPYAKELGSEGIERIRFAALKLSSGSLERLRESVWLAKVDWRDVLVFAGFGNDVQAHLHWLADDQPGEGDR